VKVAIIAIISLMIPLVTVMTVLIRVPIPATQGYLNFGDAMVILVGMLYGSYVGLIAGGIGSSLADILLGYSGFAPVTFIAKGIEGFIVGVIFVRFHVKSKLLAYSCGIIGGLFMVLSYFIFESYVMTPAAALVELPYNIIQMLFGSVLAYSLYWLVEPRLVKISK